ncbi:MAG: hypothetical protein ACREMM_11365 [Gemmatimonadales bacterium]
MKTLLRTLTLAVALTALVGGAAVGQDRRDEQFYYPGAFNWTFLQNYNEAARLFNAFDYGHAVLYETLHTRRDSATAARELEKQYRYLTTDLLVRPPRFAVAEEVIEPSYAKLAWRAKLMFDWAHVLHRQLYDVYADERIVEVQKDSLVERLTDYYLSRPDMAFVPVPKSMALMDEQYYSQVFRHRYPKFNGLIWAYHWLQVGLYEPFLAGQTPSEREAGVQAAVARFWGMLKDPPRSMPRIMPMTASVAPAFTARHPRAAAIFDNLHMMHDIISDILAADTVPRDRKRGVIYAVLAEFRDSTRNVMTRDEWLMMGDHMGGIDAMGGPVLGRLETRAPVEPALGEHEGMPGMQAATPPAPDTMTSRAAAGFLRVFLAKPARRAALLADSSAHRSVLELIRVLPEPDRTALLGLLHRALRGATKPAPRPDTTKAHPHRP